MIEYYLNTGNIFDSSLYHERGSVSSKVGYINVPDTLTSAVDINGLSLLETRPSISVIAQTEIINNSGDFFLSGFSLRTSTGNLHIDLDFPILSYDIIKSGAHSFYSSNTHTGLVYGFSGILGDSLSGDFVFLNGQKLVSGISYIEENKRFKWIDTETGVAGSLFSSPKPSGIYLSGGYDYYGSFNRGATTCFLNGVKLHEDSFLETSRFVPIDSGISSVISITGASFDTFIL